MENKTKGAGDDYPVIPQVKEELCPTCGSAWGNINGMYCSNSFHLATPAIQKELAFLKEENALLKECFELSEQAKNHLRTKGYGWTGLDILKTCELVPFSDNK